MFLFIYCKLRNFFISIETLKTINFFIRKKRNHFYVVKKRNKHRNNNMKNNRKNK